MIHIPFSPSCYQIRRSIVIFGATKPCLGICETKTTFRLFFYNQATAVEADGSLVYDAWRRKVFREDH